MTNTTLEQAVAVAMLNSGRRQDGLPTVASFDGFSREDEKFWMELAKAAIAAMQVRCMNGAVRDKFEEWACLAPVTPLDKDGDGEYEDSQARWMWRVWETAYKKGAWNGAAEMQNICNIDHDRLCYLEAAHEEASAELDLLCSKVAKYESDHPWATDNQEIAEECVAKYEDAKALVGELVAALKTCESNKGFMNDEQWFDCDKVADAITKAQAFMEGKV